MSSRFRYVGLNETDYLLETDVTWYGASGNGITDDTVGIQRAIDTGAPTIIIPDGTYLIDAATSIKPKSNQSIQMSADTVLKAIPNASSNYAIIKLVNVSNVEISGGTVLGERNEHTGTTGEWGYGILISGNTDTITIRDLTSKNCWGDGIYIGAKVTPAKNVLIDNIVCDNNRRQGMSITFAENVRIKNSTFKNTNGTNPQAGIDVEPNANCYVKNVMIENSSFLDNVGYGIVFTGYNGLYVDNAKISNCVFSNNYKDLLIFGANVTNSGYVDE